MLRTLDFETMVQSLHATPGQPSAAPPALPERWMAGAAECCACLFPGLWRRRCLFRSLLIMDWAHQQGIAPTLNVGMRLAAATEQGHCWLSVGDRAFCESGGWPRDYTLPFHRGRNIAHWAILAPNADRCASHRGQVAPKAGP
jgi:hypothetical protein